MGSGAMRAALTCVLMIGCGGASASGAGPSSAAANEPPRWALLTSPTTESLRGLSAVSADVIWASGAHGTVVRSTDGGDSWSVTVVPGAEALDFRDLHALDDARAVVLSAGAPARAFRTGDGGVSWTETYTRDVAGIFFDSLAFWDEREGLAMGDPLESEDGARFAVIATHDGGLSWEERVGPLAREGEAAFAASNGCIALPEPGLAFFATGGSVARVFRSTDFGATWTSAEAPMTHGLGSAGIFSIAFRDARVGYVVGGDYAAPNTPGSFARTEDGGRSWRAGSALRGFRSAIAVAQRALLVVGTSGAELSRDEGASWEPIGDEPLNAIAIVGTTAFAVGPGGVIARLTLGPRL